MSAPEKNDPPSAFDAVFDGASKSLTIAEVAVLLDVARSTVERWVQEGTIPAYRLGDEPNKTRWMIFRDELKETFANRKNAFGQTVVSKAADLTEDEADTPES